MCLCMGMRVLGGLFERGWKGIRGREGRWSIRKRS
jgi:hypothetical protein